LRSVFFFKKQLTISEAQVNENVIFIVERYKFGKPYAIVKYRQTSVIVVCKMSTTIPSDMLLTTALCFMFWLFLNDAWDTFLQILLAL